MRFFMFAESRRTSLTWEVLRSFPRKLWLCYFRAFLDSLSFYQFVFVLVPFLEHDHRLGDVDAANVYGLFGLNSVLIAALGDSIVDFRARGAFFTATAYTIVFASRTALALVKHPGLLCSIMFVVLPLSTSFSMAQMDAAIFANTDASNRHFAFVLYDIADSVGGALAGMSCDIIRYWFQNGIDIDFARSIHRPDETHLSPYELILVTSALASAFVALLSIFGIGHEQRVAELGENKLVPDSVMVTPLQRIGNRLSSGSTMVLVLITAAVFAIRTTHRHLEVTLPTFMDRVHGDWVGETQWRWSIGAPWGTYLAMHKLGNAFFGPLVRAAFARVSPLTTFLSGALLATLACGVLVNSHSLWALLAFVIILALAEMIWSPPTYVLLSALHRRDLDAGASNNFICTVVSSALSVAVVGLSSGHLLAAFCPESGDQRPAVLWHYVTAGSLAGPVVALLLWCWSPRSLRAAAYDNAGGNDGYEYEGSDADGDAGEYENLTATRHVKVVDDESEYNDFEDDAIASGIHKGGKGNTPRKAV